MELTRGEHYLQWSNHRFLKLTVRCHYCYWNRVGFYRYLKFVLGRHDFGVISAWIWLMALVSKWHLSTPDTHVWHARTCVILCLDYIGLWWWRSKTRHCFNDNSNTRFFYTEIFHFVKTSLQLTIQLWKHHITIPRNYVQMGCAVLSHGFLI